MNLRNVLSAYSKLRQLTDDESALLETLRNATDAERELLVETLSPQKSPTKRAGKKSASRGASKSSRASSLAEQIKRAASNDKPSSNQCATCGNDEDYADHSHPSPHYHEFDVGKSSASPAPRAGAKSSTNGGTGSTAQNLETSADAAQDVATGSS